MIAKADIRRVQEWMGHADTQTTMRYLRYASRSDDAQLVAEAFRVAGRGRKTPGVTELETPACARGMICPECVRVVGTDRELQGRRLVGRGRSLSPTSGAGRSLTCRC